MTPKSRKSPAYFREIVGNQTVEAAPHLVELGLREIMGR